MSRTGSKTGTLIVPWFALGPPRAFPSKEYNHYEVLNASGTCARGREDRVVGCGAVGDQGGVSCSPGRSHSRCP
ncbi:hypothetical protein NSPZN2_11558 [Nitrospira defluvii]|uniref:Secreted protein n=1 Tax=Nitrospira defluvii TaxID=330214 RepID=A0ABM8QVS9_9BACT|nr:hypothetical protein NSPZN2_11558 [Nitrospira defluvii]